MCHVLGHEGEGSLHAELDARGWVDGLYAGLAVSCRDGALLELSIELTRAGEAALDDVLALAWRWIRLARDAGPNRPVFDDLSTQVRRGKERAQEGVPFGTRVAPRSPLAHRALSPRHARAARRAHARPRRA